MTAIIMKAEDKFECCLSTQDHFLFLGKRTIKTKEMEWKFSLSQEKK
jgi:hypothetical protein